MKHQYLIIGSLLALALIVIAVVMMSSDQSDLYQDTTPTTLSDEQMELTDVGAEIETLDTDFDADLQKLDTELKGL